MTSYSVSNDKDPCTYTFCKANSDICKLRIDFETMQIAGPTTFTSAAPFAGTADSYKLSYKLGDCETDTMTVTNPGGATPPLICGYNTGQHMWVPANDKCNTINFDIDTGSTATTRTWQVKVTQFECNDFMAPEQDCLQYHTADSGTIASFNFDTRVSTAAEISHSTPTSVYHLNSQYYDICIRRKRGFCRICYTPKILGAAATGSSYGLGGSSTAPAQTAGVGPDDCTGVSTISATEATNMALGDYLHIVNLQTETLATAAPATGIGLDRVCSGVLSGTADAAAQATICSYATPFRVGVHLDDEEVSYDPIMAANMDHFDVPQAGGNGAGPGYLGFWLDYWQVAC